MAYKTILLHLDKYPVAKNRIRIAANLANAEKACLIGAAMIGVSTQTFRRADIDEKDPALAAHLKFLHERVGTYVTDFENDMKRFGVSSYEGRVVDGEASEGISLLGRVSDLVIIGMPDPNEPAPSVPSDFPEYVMMNSGRPVLMIPQSYQGDNVGNRVMICWNASRESIRAVADSLPLLQRADLVQIAMFNIEDEPDVDAELAGSDLALYLARQGINVEVLKPQNSRQIGDAVLALAREQKSDLLVMGGYGHTKFREFLLGGVTRTVLADAKLPVLMSH